ncbi:hypothetical protein H105_04202 [Trichophyton soudanense CBS 452.61]|uniref:Uncharacterized protein n=1 Tax=Trichophyton soudanense CBS 452.61 TaxID=1215331 RepID=A0A022XU55_TRISD|nr:hypothetical protein H105_04202 [Trichophyton soudanense CBS 452.61]
MPVARVRLPSWVRSARIRETPNKLCLREVTSIFFESLAYGCMRSHRMRRSSLGGFNQLVSVNDAVQINFAIGLQAFSSPAIHGAFSLASGVRPAYTASAV